MNTGCYEAASVPPSLLRDEMRACSPVAKSSTPIAGQLDDAIVVAAVLRSVLRAPGETPLREHWPGPDTTLRTVLRLAGAAA
jgi:hypothetical protein